MINTSAAPTELGTKSVGQLLKDYAVPGIIAMTASSLYNMVDSMFIGHIKDVGAYAISGLAVTFPLMNLSTALGTLVGAGASTVVSMLLGQKNYDAARKVLGNVVSLNVIVGALFTLVSLCFLEPILYFFGASEVTMPFAKSYMTILLIGNIITHLYFGLNGIIRSSGNPKTAMGLTIFTVVSNTILDPIFIYVFDMGIQGAAVATVLCQLLALSYTFKFFLDKKNFLTFPKGIFRLDARVAKSSLTIGLAPFLMNSAACLVTLFINQQLRKYGGDLAIGAYGIVNRISFLFIMIGMGLNQGMQPIASYNFGAKKYSRVKEVFKTTAGWATLVTTLGFIISEFFPGVTVSAFTSDPELKELSIKGLRCINIMLPFVGFSMVSGNFFQCLGLVGKSIFLSLSRQLLFLLPLLYLLPLKFHEIGVWLSFPIADTIAIIVSFTMILQFFRKFNKINDGEDIGGIKL